MSEIEEKGERSKETTEAEVKIVDPETQVNGKRIAKNTLLLYVRMIVIMLISLYTSRVVLRVLGVEDFGVYNVVGGAVGMMALLTASMGSAISRFLTFELGTGDKEKLHRVFCTSVNIQLLFSIIAIIIGETVGLWFLYNKLNIPAERIDAAFWVMQLSLGSFVLSLLNAPFNACIISHERMGVFALVGMCSACFKLCFIILLEYTPWDKLITYAAILFGIETAVRIFYGIYCSSKFSECKYQLRMDRNLTKQMFSFAGWNLFGSGSYLLMNTGVNMLVNIYFNVAMNTARGIATQVEHSVASFYSNFTTALNPQITKQIAQKDYASSNKLIATGAKAAFFLSLMVSMPVLLEMEYLLRLWLEIVPDYAATFAQLTLIAQLVSVISIPLVTAMLASGKIRKYQIIVGSLGFLVFFVSWLLFELGFGPEAPYIVIIIVFILQLLTRLILLIELVKLDTKNFITNVLLRCLTVSIIGCMIPIIISYTMEEGFARLVLVCLASVFSTVIAAYLIGINRHEREYLIGTIKTKVIRRNK